MSYVSRILILGPTVSRIMTNMSEPDPEPTSDEIPIVTTEKIRVCQTSGRLKFIVFKMIVLILKRKKFFHFTLLIIVY